MECRGQVLLDAKLLAEGSSEMGGEPRVPIADYLFGEAKPSVDVVEIELCNLGAFDSGGTWEEYGRPRTSMVDYR